MSEKKKLRKKSTRLYPKFSLMEALKLGKSIVNNNAGEPFDRLLLADSVNYSPGSGTFRMLITASSKYGITKGGYQASKIELTDLGRSILMERTEEEKLASLKKALFNIPFFKDFFTKYNTHKLPSKKLLKNILIRDYKIPQDDTEQCYKILFKNAEELKILKEIKGSNYINLSALDTGAKAFDIEEETVEEDHEVDEKEIEIDESGTKIKKIVKTNEEIREWKPKVFISHSKNNQIIEQIKQVLVFGQFDYVIAEELETTAIPIPDKIFGLMRECNCAIINISADDQEKLADDSYKINENVLIEIGASFLMYNKKVILLVDKRMKLPSNLQGLYRCEYEGDKLTWDTGLKLQESLKDFRKRK